MAQNSHRLIGLLIKAHHAVTGLELLLGIAVWKIYHSILKHRHLLSVSLLHYRSVSSVMRVTWAPFIFCFNTLNMRWIWVPLGINAFIFLSGLFFVRAFVKLNLRQVNIRSCVFVRFCSTNAYRAVCNFGLVTLCRGWKNCGVVACLITIFLIILNAIQWILSSCCRIIFVINKLASSTSCW
jgi:hypothetical protein